MANPQSNLQTLTVAQSGLAARLSISEAGPGYLLKIKVDSLLLTSTLITVPSASYGLLPALDQLPGSSTIEVNGDSLLINSTGPVETSTYMESNSSSMDPATNTIDVKFMQEDQVVYAASLQIPPPDTTESEAQK